MTNSGALSARYGCDHDDHVDDENDNRATIDNSNDNHESHNGGYSSMKRLTATWKINEENKQQGCVHGTRSSETPVSTIMRRRYGPTVGQTDEWMNGLPDRRTDGPSCRDASSH